MAATPRWTVMEASDSEQVVHILQSKYDTGLKVSEVQDGTMRLASLDAGPFTVGDLNLPMDGHYTSDTIDLLIMQLSQGTLWRALGGDEQCMGPGELMVLAQPGQPYRAAPQQICGRTVLIDRGVLQEVAGTAAGTTPGPVRFTGYRPHSPAAARWWKRTVDYLADDLLGDPEAAAQPLLVANAARLLAGAALATFPNTALTDTPAKAQRNNAATPALLRHATAYIDDHAHRDIALADIAAAVHVTPRALQYAFRQHLDTTPTAYLRRVRLEHAHRELTAADPATGQTVTTVAARWGFLHPGRFATAYRRAYGRSPSHTLRS
ncbi:helix-turn-helix domain-containing protein [Streptomyces sp. NPDC006733]|uniref:helix-turn-helix domain-containing protein n=1 Tax=Streptomyces sp. NPDC006733 TaxID=3155460 RepID=UPI0034032E53